MVVLVCGSRTWCDRDLMMEHLENLSSHSEDGAVTIIHGGANGADQMAHGIAMGLGYSYRAYPADWVRHGRSAGWIRNQQMLDEGKPDIVLAFWDGKSRGTADMIRRARKAKLPVEIIKPRRLF